MFQYEQLQRKAYKNCHYELQKLWIHKYFSVSGTVLWQIWVLFSWNKRSSELMWVSHRCTRHTSFTMNSDQLRTINTKLMHQLRWRKGCWFLAPGPCGKTNRIWRTDWGWKNIAFHMAFGIPSSFSLSQITKSIFHGHKVTHQNQSHNEDGVCS